MKGYDPHIFPNGRKSPCGDRLNKEVNVGTISMRPESLSRLVLILSSPVALFGFKRLIASMTKS